MANVIIEGVFMGVNVKTSTFEGNSKSSVQIDIYQPEAQGEKAVSIKADDLGLFQSINNDYSIGSVFSAKCSVNAYKNNAYYKLVQLLEVKQPVKI
jgi:hypothetical protein